MAQLLVSVRSANEAIEAIAGGADIIDIKEPKRGALGRADLDTVQSVLNVVGNRTPVSMACGELVEAPDARIPAALRFAKIGLARCASATDSQAVAWQSRWQEWVSKLPPTVQPVAVIYADSPNAQSPSAVSIIQMSQALHCQGILIDTYCKKPQHSLFDCQNIATLSAWIRAARDANQFVAMAGSLTADLIPHVLQLDVDVVALRGAACINGRKGAICKQKIRELSNVLTNENRRGPCSQFDV